eukprot:13204694-Ditylum_brightwellii.AAC.1
MSTSDSITPFLQDNKKYESLPKFALPLLQAKASNITTDSITWYIVKDSYVGPMVNDVVAKLHNCVQAEKGLNPSNTADIESLEVVDFTKHIKLIGEDNDE